MCELHWKCDGYCQLPWVVIGNVGCTPTRRGRNTSGCLSSYHTKLWFDPCVVHLVRNSVSCTLRFHLCCGGVTCGRVSDSGGFSIAFFCYHCKNESIHAYMTAASTLCCPGADVCVDVRVHATMCCEFRWCAAINRRPEVTPTGRSALWGYLNADRKPCGGYASSNFEGVHSLISFVNKFCCEHACIR
jgi:hypothetical protein